MPLFLDIHKGLDDLTPQKIAEAHRMDLIAQRNHHVEYLNYWFNEKEGIVFCLCEAPSKEAALAVHREAHGIMPDEIIEVVEGN